MKPYFACKKLSDLGTYCDCCKSKYQKHRSNKFKGGKKRARQEAKKRIKKED